MSDEFPKLDLNGARVALERLFEQVSAGKGRIEVTRDNEACVLISKTELESLERALEILADSDGCREMKELIARLAANVSAEPAVV